jgi:tetratricopeptide (TPR) repeat protein
MKCPVCGCVYRPTQEIKTCRRCQADLSDLIRLHDQAIYYHRLALNLFQKGYYLEAAIENNRAIALQGNCADFHALDGKLWALQGHFHQAIAAWNRAIKINPENQIADHCLQIINKLRTLP